MGRIRIWRRVRIAPGVTLNVGKRGVSTSIGVRGAHATFGRRGVRRTVGIPGTGIFYTSSSAHHARAAAVRRRAVARTGRPQGSGLAGIVELFHKTPPAKIGYGLLLTVLVITAPIGLPLLVVGIYQLFFSSRYRARSLVARAERAPAPDAGRAAIENALKVHPDDAEVLAGSAAWYESHEEWNAAADLHARYLSMHPSDIPARGHYGRCLLLAGHPDLAIEQLAYVRQSPLDEDSRASVTTFLALAFLSKSDASQALALVREEPLQRHALGSGLQQCLYLRAVCQYLVGQTARAVSDLERLYALNPAYPDVLANKAAMQVGTFLMSTPLGAVTRTGMVPNGPPHTASSAPLPAAPAPLP